METRINRLFAAMLAVGISPAVSAYDPLYSEQWHLDNTGQTAFAANPAVAGNDLNTKLTQAMGIAGVGVKVAVIDSGVQIDHPDLAGNVVTGSRNFVEDSPFPADYPVDANGHGTAVAGLISAVGNNGEGVRGVASRSSLMGFNWLANQTLEGWLISHGADASTSDVRVFNQSYGFSPITPIPFDENDPQFKLEMDVMKDVSESNAWGRGAVFVKSAGNGYRYFNTGRFFVLPSDFFAGGGNQGLPMHNSAQSYDNSSYYNLVTSALRADGTRASYSSVGANVWVAAPAGEYGQDFPAMVTTDLMGCEEGQNTSADLGINGLHGGTEQDPSCNYTSTMNGTSSAAPNTSGAIAAIMSTNHALTARDVRALLAETASVTDKDHPGVQLEFVNNQGELVSYEAISPWQKNAAGVDFHTFYGFGAVNLDEAMKRARMTNNVLPAQIITPWASNATEVSVPDASLVGGSSAIAVTDDITVESVQVKLTLEHSRLPDLAIELISPSGTRSVLQTPRNGLVGQSLDPNVTGYENQLLLSNQFYGEDAKGEWTLRAIDTNGDEVFSFIAYFNSSAIYDVPMANNAKPGVIKNWSMRIFGH
ncbi:P/Homo B domain-containing protein [Vibrio owensii]|uniref:S8 family peptidase n=1 Tax=Vibrio TaxID=662 RepID=UPI0005EF2E66|nr:MULTISPECIES: S8 family peptidase [Vibrio]MDA0384650.1 S8 family peptidase [Vibrio owensii]NOI70097.1 S8 family serine peptidase [Vibrio owensii]CAD7824738.1 Belongs to the peptidase S8 family [Vibrio sp. B1ASS3]CAE6954385.1 Belongs to the peptidase S8 family [Vibrio sp. B1ASS3]CAH1520007.1 P/Homo B domain-containing protein [Vibrio owensii]